MGSEILDKPQLKKKLDALYAAHEHREDDDSINRMKARNAAIRMKKNVKPRDEQTDE